MLAFDLEGFTEKLFSFRYEIQFHYNFESLEAVGTELKNESIVLPTKLCKSGFAS